MTAQEMQRLVNNVRADGALTSVVLCCEEPDGTLEILSGHHRTKAATIVGLPSVTAMVITSPLTEQQKVAIQLSHNAVVGKDDKTTLAELYGALDLTWKLYSGLTDDDVIGFKALDLAGIGAGSINYEETTILFLPEDRATVLAALKRFEKERPRKSALLAPLEAYSAFFDAIVATKEHFNVGNAAVAMTVMAELALERLAQIEAEKGEAA